MRPSRTVSIGGETSATLSVVGRIARKSVATGPVGAARPAEPSGSSARPRQANSRTRIACAGSLCGRRSEASSLFTGTECWRSLKLSPPPASPEHTHPTPPAASGIPRTRGDALRPTRTSTSASRHDWRGDQYCLIGCNERRWHGAAEVSPQPRTACGRRIGPTRPVDW
jgi:hypothetical protein